MKAILTEDSFNLLKKYNPCLTIRNLFSQDGNPEDIQNVSLSLFDVKIKGLKSFMHPSISKRNMSLPENVFKDPKGYIKRMLAIAQHYKDSNAVTDGKLPEKEGSYGVKLCNVLNPYIEHTDIIYYSLEDGWRANKETPLSFSYKVKHWIDE